MSNQAVIDVRGEGGGEIRINSNDVNLSNSNIFAGISEEANVPDAVAGDIVIKAPGLVRLDGGGISSRVEEVAVGDAGVVQIEADSLEVVNGAEISADISGKGDGGTVHRNG
jgi:hypothetical protein